MRIFVNDKIFLCYYFMDRHTRRRPLGINFANAAWTLWPEDAAHRARMVSQLMGQRPENEVLPGVPQFIGRHLNTRHRDITRTHLQPFLRFQQGHTYMIYINPNSQYVRDMHPPPPLPYIHATFHYYEYRNVPHVRMRVHRTNLTLQVNQIYVFDIRDFSNFLPPQDITTPQSLAQFQEERRASAAAVNGIVMNAIARQRTVDGTPFPVPHYLYNLNSSGGKSKKNKRKRK